MAGAWLLLVTYYAFKLPHKYVNYYYLVFIIIISIQSLSLSFWLTKQLSSISYIDVITTLLYLRQHFGAYMPTDSTQDVMPIIGWVAVSQSNRAISVERKKFQAIQNRCLITTLSGGFAGQDENNQSVYFICSRLMSWFQNTHGVCIILKLNSESFLDYVTRRRVEIDPVKF